MAMRLPRLNKLRILITGGLGFIGSNLAHRCLELGAKVTVYDCLDPKSGGNMFNIKGIEDDIDLVIDDMRNFGALSAAVVKKDIVFNCAAYTSHPNSMKEPLIDIDVNCKGTIHLLEALRRFTPETKVVHVGTSTQVGSMVHKRIDELHPEYPVDIYSANKCASEKYVLIYGNAYKMDTTVIRLANNFGPRSNIKTPDFGFMNYFIGLGLQGKEIHVFGKGGQLRNISFIDDSVSALILASRNAKARGEVFFAVADRQYTIAEIAKAVTKIIGGKVRFVEWPKERESIEIGDAVISNHKIKESLSWKPQCNIEEGLIGTKDYFLPYLDKYL